ncbi:Subtilisin-like protease SBT1.7 [Hibiscus syriacus]|uniref:Subtilisin-like protease SBT1.7 n=1 Tax=Hibiscus syriacus TaxID=106335 RepID=A0A6A2XQJ5_HIBSY|nr:Subtilisin-like protease SBT1.7 [Hibiscus syriacus]
MASFSSRGPNTIEPSILKPDVTAPRVNIIAAFSESIGPTEDESNKRRVPFALQSGTSMSCPHVSGIVGLLKSLHPDWSAVAIKSAIMITARIRDDKGKPMLDSSNEKTTPFDYGSGHVRLNRAMDPGLVYNLTIEDYLNFLCARGYNQTTIRLFSDKPFVCSKAFSVMDLNHPSIEVHELNGTVTVSRTVKNVGPARSTYKARVRSPAGVTILVNPSILEFEKSGEKKRFEVKFESNSDVESQEYVFGELLWSDGKHNVRSPIVVMH